MQPLIDHQELTQLQNLLYERAQDQDTMDYYEAYGYITHHILCPGHLEEEFIAECILFNPSDEEEQDDDETVYNDNEKLLLILLKKLIRSIEKQLYLDNQYELPCDATLQPSPENAPLRGWAIGFMDGYFEFEASWLNLDEEMMSLILPIAIAAGESIELPDEHPLNDKDQLEEALALISDNVLDLYVAIKQ
ncbi:MAG: UPF0149 family protein [Pseudomonadota bacterium]